MKHFKLFAACFALAALAFTATAHADLATIADSHFEGGQNLDKGHKRGTDSTLGELIKDIQTNKASQVNTTFSATFTQGVGAKTVLVKKIGKLVLLEIPTGSTADGGGGSIASGAGAVPAAYRPAADLSFPVVVTDNGALVFGKLVLSSAGTLTFTVGAAGGNFTDNAAAGFDRQAIAYSVP